VRGACFGAVAVDGLVAVLRVEPGGIVVLLRQRLFQHAQLRVAVEHELQRGQIGVSDLLFDEARVLPACSETSPPSGLISPRIRRNSVDLPQPFLPTRPMRWSAKA